MKKTLLALSLISLLAACSDVPSGHVGVKVQKFGDDRGVNLEVKGPGRYLLGWNEDWFMFPTFTQNVLWDKAVKEDGKDKGDESFSFQVEGMTVNTDVGASYLITADCAPKVFQKYRKGVDEITSIVLRSMIRETLTSSAADMKIEDVYAAKRKELQDTIEKKVIADASKVCITVEEVFFVNEMRLPEAVKKSIDNKVAATQIAQQKENELRSAKADAEKEIERARGEAEATRIRGEALRTNPQALQQMAIEKWDGALPQYMGANTPLPFINVQR